MLKKFNLVEYLFKEENYEEDIFEKLEFIEEEDELVLEAVQGNVTKETLPHLFSNDTIKYLYQFEPDDHGDAEYIRYQILFKAMQDRQEYYSEFFSTILSEEKKKIENLFEKQKQEIKIYLNPSLKDTIINHCAQKAAFEKVNNDKLEDWWKDTSRIGGKKYLEPYPVKIGTKTYKVNLFLKDMVARIEGSSLSKTGADLSFPQKWIEKNKEGKNTVIKRFSGMILPSQVSIKQNIEEWKSAIANGLLTAKMPKDDEIVEIPHITKKIGEGAYTAKVNYDYDYKNKNKKPKDNVELYETERVILTKELRSMLEKDNWVYRIKRIAKKLKEKEKDKTASAEEITDLKKSVIASQNEYYNRFILDFNKVFSFGNDIFSKISSSEKYTDPVTKYEFLKNPQLFFNEILKLDEKSKQTVDYLLRRMAQKKDSKGVKYDLLIKEGTEDFMNVLKDQSLLNSFYNFMVLKQVLFWVKNKNFKHKNVRTGEEENAYVDEKTNELVFPKLIIPKFKKHISYEEGGKPKSVQVNMPYLIAGKVLKEKSRYEMELADSPSDTAEMYDPISSKFKKRYIDKTGISYSGIQGSEDKLKGGIRPNQNIESFEFMCPSESDIDKTDNFWTRIKHIISSNNGLSQASVKISADPEVSPELVLKPLSVPYDSIPVDSNIVINDVAKSIWSSLKINKIEDQRSLREERIVAAKNFLSLYNLIISKIISNIGDQNMVYDKKKFKAFLKEKVQIYLQQELVQNRKARRSRIEDGEKTSKVYDDPSYFMGKKYATFNIERYVRALEEHSLHLCRTGKDILQCSHCYDPIDGKCNIYLDIKGVASRDEEIIPLLKEIAKAKETKVQKPSKVVSKAVPATSTPMPTPTLSAPKQPTAVPSATPAPAATQAPISMPTPEQEPAAEKVAHVLPQQQEHVRNLEGYTLDLVINKILLKMEQAKLDIATEKYKELEKLYSDQGLSIEESDKLMSEKEKQYDELTNAINIDHRKLKDGAIKLKQHYSDFSKFILDLLHIYKMDNLASQIKTELK